VINRQVCVPGSDYEWLAVQEVPQGWLATKLWPKLHSGFFLIHVKTKQGTVSRQFPVLHTLVKEFRQRMICFSFSRS
jgi:hypothetical protein